MSTAEAQNSIRVWPDFGVWFEALMTANVPRSWLNPSIQAWQTHLNVWQELPKPESGSLTVSSEPLSMLHRLQCLALSTTQWNRLNQTLKQARPHWHEPVVWHWCTPVCWTADRDALLALPMQQNLTENQLHTYVGDVLDKTNAFFATDHFFLVAVAPLVWVLALPQRFTAQPVWQILGRAISTAELAHADSNATVPLQRWLAECQMLWQGDEQAQALTMNGLWLWPVDEVDSAQVYDLSMRWHPGTKPWPTKQWQGKLNASHVSTHSVWHGVPIELADAMLAIENNANEITTQAFHRLFVSWLTHLSNQSTPSENDRLVLHTGAIYKPATGWYRKWMAWMQRLSTVFVIRSLMGTSKNL